MLGEWKCEECGGVIYMGEGHDCDPAERPTIGNDGVCVWAARIEWSDYETGCGHKQNTGLGFPSPGELGWNGCPFCLKRIIEKESE